MFKKKDVKRDDFLWIGEAARVLGISRMTVIKRINAGQFRNVQIIMTTNGRQFNKYDVFRMAFPQANDNKLAELMFDYNVNYLGAKRARLRKKNRGKKK